MERTTKIKCSLCGDKFDELDLKTMFNEVQNGNIYCEACFGELSE
jgi:hypothetical protein